MDVKDRKEPTFTNIDDVLSLARELAEQDYAKHLQMMVNAKTSEEREVALKALDRSVTASKALSVAYENFGNSRETAKAGTSDMLHGREKSAQENFSLSGDQMQSAAKDLEVFTAYIPQSKSFALAMDFVAKKDEYARKIGPSIDGAIAGIEMKAARTVESFTLGLKSFASTMKEFGKTIASTPDRIKTVAKEKALTTVEATATVMAGLMSRTLRFFKSTKDSALEKIDSAIDASIALEEKVIGKIDKSVQAIDQKVDAGMDALRAHRKATVESIVEKADQAREMTLRGRDVAWDTIDRLGQASIKLGSEIKSTAIESAETIERHSHGAAAVAVTAAKLPGQIAGHIMRSLGASVASSYNEAVAEAAENQKKRKNPRP